MPLAIRSRACANAFTCSCPRAKSARKCGGGSNDRRSCRPSLLTGDSANFSVLFGASPLSPVDPVEFVEDLGLAPAGGDEADVDRVCAWATAARFLPNTKAMTLSNKLSHSRREGAKSGKGGKAY